MAPFCTHLLTLFVGEPVEIEPSLRAVGVPANTESLPEPATRQAVAATPQLLDQVRQAIRTRHYSYRTEEAYVEWIRRFLLFHDKRHPAEMGAVEVSRFLTALAMERRVASSTQNQALAAILFLHKDVLDRDFVWLDDVVRAKRPQRLPVVLTRQEVQALLAALDGVSWIMGTLLYGSGLCLMECLRLRWTANGVGSGSFPRRPSRSTRARASSAGITCTSPCRSGPSVKQNAASASRNRLGRTRCATASPHICWKRATTFARSRSCSGTVT